MCDHRSMNNGCSTSVVPVLKESPNLTTICTYLITQFSIQNPPDVIQDGKSIILQLSWNRLTFINILFFVCISLTFYSIHIFTFYHLGSKHIKDLKINCNFKSETKPGNKSIEYPRSFAYFKIKIDNDDIGDFSCFRWHCLSSNFYNR